MATDSPYGRRDFLKDSVVSVAKAAKEFNKRQEIVPERPIPAPVRTDWLRPPGAANEALFLERCTQCGDCGKVCPYGSITFHPQNGTPVIFADQTPCYLCEDVPCIAACATEALLPVEGRGQIRMGLASVSHRVCTAGQGCHACASKCPTDALSMDFDRQQIVVTAERCVGCGLCEHVCRTVNEHVAIRVTPDRLLPQAFSRPTRTV
ncbi:MAG TPA: 4Fe-4S dicluster domain-containing protein [Nitrospiraceae bacterium]|nr:4Fe-4S dicluster domain-containing protein [Nitrospiraceae bacterium]